MLVRQIADSKLAQFSYLIGCPRTGEAIVIDPERDVFVYASKEGGPKWQYEWLIHGCRASTGTACCAVAPSGIGVHRCLPQPSSLAS